MGSFKVSRGANFDEHNGLKNIKEVCGVGIKEFVTVAIGIGAPTERSQEADEDYTLDKFTED